MCSRMAASLDNNIHSMRRGMQVEASTGDLSG